jgi:hypothetical protein
MCIYLKGGNYSRRYIMFRNFPLGDYWEGSWRLVMWLHGHVLGHPWSGYCEYPQVHLLMGMEDKHCPVFFCISLMQRDRCISGIFCYSWVQGLGEHWLKRHFDWWKNESSYDRLTLLEGFVVYYLVYSVLYNA